MEIIDFLNSLNLIDFVAIDFQEASAVSIGLRDFLKGRKEVTFGIIEKGEEKSIFIKSVDEAVELVDE